MITCYKTNSIENSLNKAKVKSWDTRSTKKEIGENGVEPPSVQTSTKVISNYRMTFEEEKFFCSLSILTTHCP